MESSIQKALTQAFIHLFRPLARTLIRNGVPFSAMAEWAKKVYVDVAFEEFREPGRKQSISRVSALTGLFRREVKRLHELDVDTGLNGSDRYNRAVRVISGWLNDERFLDAKGEPRDLPFDGEGATFSVLVRAYSGDITPRAMLTVLESADCVQASADGRLRLVSHAFIPGGDATDKLHILGTDVAELIATIDHNLTAPAADRYFQRKVSNMRLDSQAVDEFRALASRRSQALLEELDVWLSAHEVDESDPDYPVHNVSLGIYYAQHPVTASVSLEEPT